MTAPICIDCGQSAEPLSQYIGVVRTAEDEPVCPSCASKREEEMLLALPKGGRGILYWTGTEITDWLGGFRISPSRVRVGKHNIAGQQTHVWFSHGGRNYRGRNVGDDQILRVTAL